MHVSSAFDGGNIDFHAMRETADGLEINVNIRKDHCSEFFQWFYFRISGVQGQPLICHIDNAHQASYPAGWDGYTAVMSYDRQTWTRVHTGYNGHALTIRHTPIHDIVYYAYFAPYSHERHQDLLAQISMHPHCRVLTLGQSLDGRAIDCVDVHESSGDGALPLWIIARQHPGETMAEWFMEGLINRLLSNDDPEMQNLRRAARFYLVPNMNPDGSVRGHLRTNAAGVNLNRVWSDPTASESPEVYVVRNRMHETGVALFLDVHGDEGLPYAFIAGSGGIPSLSDAQAGLLQRFPERLQAVNEAFQTAHGYPPTPAGRANLSMASNHIAETFGALAMTLEMPFKDPANASDPVYGWSPDRAQQLGRDCLSVIHELLPELAPLKRGDTWHPI